MQLIIDKPGMYIGKRENRFELRLKESREEYSADDVKQIMLLSGCAVSSGAVKLAVEKGIDIVYIDWRGMPFARVYPCTLGGTTLTRKKQLEANGNEKGAVLAKRFITGKLKNQTSFLKALAKSREDSQFLINAADEIEKYTERIPKLSGSVDYIRDQLLGIEGYSASRYFECISQLVPGFTQRERDAKDPFNAMLNYGYGILYSEVEKACIIAGLDPYLGFLHVDRYGKPCMVLDLIEEFRQPIVDRAIVTLFVQKQVSDGDFDVSGSLRLTDSGKRKVIEAVMERLHTKITKEDERKTFQGILYNQARHVANYLLGHDDDYQPFVHRW